jgi:hypothetical protein
MRGALVSLVIAMTAPLAAQWLQHRDPTLPRMKDGRPDLAAPAPRAPDGHPDLSGVWAAEPSEEITRALGAANPFGADAQFISKYALNIFADLKPDEEPLQPEAAELLRRRRARPGVEQPTTNCLPGGVPFSTLIAPFKIIQTPRLVVLLLEDNNPPRQIHTDGRRLPSDPWPSWMGYSVGRWQQNTLIVETVGFNDRSWLDTAGHPRSESMRVVERFTRRDVGHLDIEVTIEDPKMYRRPFTIRPAARLLPDTDILEAVCAENEKDLIHLGRGAPR